MVEPKILFVGHDANRAGAQLVLLHWLRERKARGFKNYLLLVDGGSLLSEYEKVAKVWVWKTEIPFWFKIKQKVPRIKSPQGWNHEPSEQKVLGMLKALKNEAFTSVLGNTVSSLVLLRALESLNIPMEVYVHELRHSLAMYSSASDREFLASKISRLYAVSDLVKNVLEQELAIAAEKIVLLPPIIELNAPKSAHHASIRETLGIPKDAKIVFSCGLAEWRKAPDVFLEVAKDLIDKMPTVHFIWLGLLDNAYSEELVLS